MKNSDCFGPCAAGYISWLCDMIAEECCDSRIYAWLAGCAPDAEAKKALKRLSYEEECHARTLQTAYYLITGRHCNPCHNGLDGCRCFCEVLRQRFMEERHGAGAYAEFAAKSKDKCLAAVTAALSECEAKHARVVYRLMETYCVRGCGCGC